MSDSRRPLPHEADPAEPAGESDPSVEAEIDQATERAEGLEAEPAYGPDAAADSVAVSEALAGEAGVHEGTQPGVPQGAEATPGTEAGADPEAETETAGGGQAGAENDADAEPAGEAEDPLARAQRERDEYLDLARRAQADFDNYRKRAARDLAAAGDKARAGLVREMLPVVDNLERALATADGHLADGVRLVLTELVAVLGRAGVEGFDPAGEPFDPERHEALSMRQQEGADSGVVLDVVEKGYTLNGTILRPARVVVAG